LYRTNDACRMQTAILATDSAHGGAADLKSRLAPFEGDSAHLVTFPDLPDTTVRFMPGNKPTEPCRRRVVEDRAGFTLYPPFLLARDGNVYLRDLHARDSLALAEHPGKEVWLVTRAPVVGSPFRFEKVSIDSMFAEWRKE
ncbi:MAG: hypothetical protein ABUL71_00580, partial [Gemmatimonadota bacterium]